MKFKEGDIINWDSESNPEDMSIMVGAIRRVMKKSSDSYEYKIEWLGGTTGRFKTMEHHNTIFVDPLFKLCIKQQRDRKLKSILK
jgi:hypothetical protein